MAQFHELKVTNVEKTVRDAVVVTLEPVNGGDFDFIPGQYLTFRKDLEGTALRRNYSICSGKRDGVLQIGIRKIAGGAFSTWANENLKPGMVLEAMEPAGKFHAPLSESAEKTYLGFAGGSGITPVLSILKSVLTEEPKSSFTLLYANRGTNTIMFREELEDLKNLYLGRLQIIHVLESDAQDVSLFQGRIDQAKCDALFETLIDVSAVDMAFICGPEPMMLEIAAALKSHGLSEEKIRFELFSSSQQGRLRQRAAEGTAAAEETVKASITLDGTTRTVEMGRDMTVLEAALQNSLDAPHACRAGVCSTCMCRLLKGQVDMVQNHALEDYEVRAGYILSCQSYPLTDEIAVEYSGGH